MPFFQGARDFDIKGGTFYDVKGNQNNHNNDQSFTLNGTGNTANFSPNLSRQDNRTYNMGYSNTGHYGYLQTQNYGFAPPQLDPQEYKMFLAWKQAGSPIAPPLPPQMISSPTQLQIAQQQLNDSNNFRGFQQNGLPTPENHPQLQFGQHFQPTNTQRSQTLQLPHDPTQHQPPSQPHYIPPPPPGWGNSQYPGYQPQVAQPPHHHPPHHRSQTQPPPGHLPGHHPLSEASDILAEQNDANPFPGFGALLSVNDRFSQQGQNSAQPPPRSQSTSVVPPSSQPPGNAQASSSSSPLQSTPIPNSSSIRAPSSSTPIPVQSPPPVNKATKPSTPQPPPLTQSVPLPTAMPSIHQQPTPPPDVKPRMPHPSSSRNSLSDEEGSQNSAQVNVAVPTASHATSAVYVPSSFNNPSQEPPTNIATSPIRHENESPFSAPLSPPTSISSDPSSIPAPNPAPVTPSFPAFPKLRPLDLSQSVQETSQVTETSDSGTDSSKKKKHKSFLHKLGLRPKKSKEGKVTS